MQYVQASWNVVAHARKPDIVFRRKGCVHLNQQGRQFSRLLAAEVRASAVVMLDSPCSEVVWKVLATHSIRQFPLYFPYPASPCAITFQLESTIYFGITSLYFVVGRVVQSVLRLRAGRSGIESRWGRDFPPVQTGPGAHPAPCKMGTGSFPGVKCGRDVLLTTHSLLVLRSWKSRAITLPTLWATPGL